MASDVMVNRRRLLQMASAATAGAALTIPGPVHAAGVSGWWHADDDRATWARLPPGVTKAVIRRA